MESETETESESERIMGKIKGEEVVCRMDDEGNNGCLHLLLTWRFHIARWLPSLPASTLRWESAAAIYQLEAPKNVFYIMFVFIF